MLEAINLSKTYTGEGIDYHVLKNINLKIDEGECAAIIGKSGSGKSTLMHLLACLDTPIEVEYYRHGGILPYVLRQLLNA